MNKVFFIISFLIIISCSSPNKNVKETSVKEEVEFLYSKEYSFYDSSKQKEVKDTVSFTEIVEEVDFTGDGVDDFFLIQNPLGGQSLAFFHDGNTGKKIEFCDSKSIIS